MLTKLPIVSAVEFTAEPGVIDVAVDTMLPESNRPPRNFTGTFDRPVTSIALLLTLESSGEALIAPRLMNEKLELMSVASLPIVIAPCSTTWVDEIRTVGALPTPLAEIDAAVVAAPSAAGPL